MGFFLTLVYLALTLLSPADLFPELAPYRIMLWVAGLAVLGSVKGIVTGPWLQLRQAYLMSGFIMAICLSRLLNGWPGGVLQALEQFLPVALVYFLIIWNVSTISQLKTLTLVLFLIALYLVTKGTIAYAYHTGDEIDPYLYIQRVSAADGSVMQIYPRIRALGGLSDPNDFAQYLVMLLPFLLPVWQRKRWFRNFCLCVLPGALVLFGTYLTNSRGGLLAVALLVVFLLIDWFGKKGAVLLVPVAVIVMLAMSQGGRAISVQEDSARGRVDAWSEGLGMFKHSPLWGMGYGSFLDIHERTAHNSFVLCLAELGLMGCLVWLGLIVASVIALKQISVSDTWGAADPAVRWAKMAQFSLYTVLATSWFLSRTYSTTFYLVLGIAAVVPVMLRDDSPRTLERSNWVLVTAVVLPVAILAVYATVHMRSI